MRSLLHDARMGVRLLAKRPGFTALAAATLAIGIGASTLIFSVVEAVLLTPPPFRDPDRLVVVWEHNIPRDRKTNVVSPANFLAWRDAQQSFTDLGAFSITATGSLTSPGREPEQVGLQLATAQLFPILGIDALVGRTFLAEEDHPDNDVALISHRLWQRRFGGSASAVGGIVTVSGRVRTIVGVMPPTFDLLDRKVDLWLPAGFSDTARDAGGRWLIPVARLRPGVELAQAQADMNRITARLAAEFPDRNAGWASNVVLLGEQLVGAVRPALGVLLAAVGFVLLIACVNVANLLLARATSRQRELAVRAALGAGRFRLVRQLLVESLALASVGAVGGVLLASWGLGTLLSATAEQFPIPRLETASLDGRVLAFAVILSLATAVMFGLAPAVSASRLNLNDALREGARGTSARHGRLRASLVVAEVALAIILLAGAGLLVRSFQHLMAVDPGFEPERVLAFQISLPGATYNDPSSRVTFFRNLTTRLTRLPGVVAAGSVSFLPLDGLGAATRFRGLDRPEPSKGQEPVTDVRMISSDYFRAMGIPLVLGRLFTEAEVAPASSVVLFAESARPATTGVVVVNEAMAREMWPGEDPIGKRLLVSWSDPEVTDEVIGVVGDVRLVSLDDTVRPTVYYPHNRTAYSAMSVVVRSTVEPASLTSAVLAQVREMDPQQPVAKIRTLEEVVGASVGQRRLIMLLAGLFAGVALLLAAVGLYGVLAYLVAERTREIGVRIALGAQRGAVLGMVIRRALGLTAIGAAAGLAGALALTRLMRSLLFQVTPSDPTTHGTVVVVLVAVALVASLIPAWRAMRVDPVVALRQE
ncbi:MAG: ABC transporter permease [Acidobacteriota bacterium]